LRLRERDLPLDPEVERELEAIEGALAGERGDPGLEDLTRVALELRRERPQPSAATQARLDELAAEGFPPRARDPVGRVHRKASEVLRPLRGKDARRVLPALGVGTACVVAIGIGVSQSGVLRGGQESAPTARTARPQTAPAPGTPDSTLGTLSARDRFSRADRGSAPTAESLTQHLPSVANRAVKRKVAQDVDLGLSTAPESFRDAADGVLDVVRDHRGFVLRSHVSGGDPDVRGADRGRASFALRIPVGQLSAAMGDLSDLGHVVSRSDGAVDVTERFVSARKQIDELTATRDRLLRELGEAATLAEQQSIRARLRIVEARLAGAHGDLAKARRRVHLVPVSVTITADGRTSSGGAWTIGDALDDAGRVLTVAAGVALVAGAALLPFALLAALIAGVRREWVRRQRDRALEAAPGSTTS
jgi:uncharacterized protein DUF4349